MKYCKIENCQNKHYARGYCINHYRVLIFYPKHRQHMHQYQSAWNKAHYIKKTHLCAALDCHKNIDLKNTYCHYHKLRFLKWGNPLEPNHTPKGEKNVNWKGGVSTYKDHYKMKKIRKELLNKHPLCQVCNKEKATNIHHKDYSKTNHAKKNLVCVCHKCHMQHFHSKPHNHSKYSRLYGYTLKQLKKIHNKDQRFLQNLHETNKLKNYLQYVK